MTLLLDETAVVRRPSGVVRVSGPDRLAHLHSLLSQHMGERRPGEVADFLYLDARGEARAMGRAVVRAGDVLLVVPEAELAAWLAEELERLTFLSEVTAVDATQEWALASVRGPDLVVEVPGARREPMTAVPHGDGLVLRDRSGGADLLGAPDWVARSVEGLGLPEADAADWERWRILAGEPAWGRDVVAGRRTQELGLLPTHVHLRKGCYPGQESIAKIHNLGRPRRALAVLGAPSPLEPGSPVRAEGTTKAGEITSAAELSGGGVALAMVPLTRDGALPTTVQTDGAEATVRDRVGAGRAQPGA